MLRRFRDFFAHGNVVRLSAAVGLGMAFAGVINAIVNNWVGPLFASFGGTNPDGLAVALIDGNRGTVIDFGAILTAIASFLVIALIVYHFVVLPVKEVELRRMLSAKFLPPRPTAVDMLDEIRGLLHRQQLNPAQATTDIRQLRVEVTRGFTTRLVVLPTNVPGLVIDYGDHQMAFTVGKGEGALTNAHEFAVNLAYTALAFASRCRVEMSPRHAARNVARNGA